MNIFGRAAKVTKETERALRRSAARGNSLAAKSVLDALDILSDTSRKLSLAERIQIDKQIKEGLKQWDIDRFKEYNKPEIDHPLDNIDQTFRGEYADMARHMAGGVLKQGESLADKGSVYVEAKAGAGAILNAPIEAGLNVALEAQARAETALKQLESFAAYCEKGNITEQIANGQAFKKALAVVENGCQNIEEALQTGKIINEYMRKQEKAATFLMEHRNDFDSVTFGNISVFRRNDSPYPHPAAVAIKHNKNGTMECQLLENETDIAEYCRSEHMPEYANWRGFMYKTDAAIVDSWSNALENSDKMPIASITEFVMSNLDKNMTMGEMLDQFNLEIARFRASLPLEQRKTDQFILRHKSADAISRNNPDKFAMILDKIAEIEEQLNSAHIDLADMNIRSSIGVLDTKFNLDPNVEKVNGEQLFVYLQTSKGTNIRISYDNAFHPGSVMVSDSSKTGQSLEDIMDIEKRGTLEMQPYISVRSGVVMKETDIPSVEAKETLKSIKDVREINEQHKIYVRAKESIEKERNNIGFER